MAHLEQEGVERDRSYAPSSGRETDAKQHDQSTHADVDEGAVTQLPGTGGPDDTGEIDMEGVELHMPRRKEAR